MKNIIYLSWKEIEYYNRNRKGLETAEDLLSIDSPDVEKDKNHKGDLNLTSVDAIRIAYDLIGRGVLAEKHLVFVQKETGLNKIIKPILHSNQYFHLLYQLKGKGTLTDGEIEKAQKILQEKPYNGI